MNEDLCVECYKECIFLPFSATMTNTVSLSEINDYPKSNNQNVSNETTLYEIQEVYELCKVQEKIEKNGVSNIPFPIYQR